MPPLRGGVVMTLMLGTSVTGRRNERQASAPSERVIGRAWLVRPGCPGREREMEESWNQNKLGA
jgi:hypothetical protein